MKRTFLVIICYLISISAFAQEYDFADFTLPVDFPISLSGNFSEPRASHFHSGIDIRTYGEGKKVYALGDGYVSRISVSPYGYGLALYVDYENGLRSVCGHLSAFCSEIDDFAKNIQYEKQSFRIDVSLTPLDLPVKKGQIIAFTGNSGSSGGPHLHFEIRNAEDDVSLNTIGNYIKISDITPPEAYSLVFYPQGQLATVNQRTEKQVVALTKISSNSYLCDTVSASGKIGIGVEYCDRITNSKNRFGVKKVDLLVNSLPIYTATFTKVDFNKQANKNSCFDFDFLENEKKYVQKLFVEPNNDLDIYTNLKNNGFLNVKQGDSLNICILLTDFNNNITKIHIPLLYDTTKKTSSKLPNLLKWDADNKMEIPGCKVEIDSGSFYTDQDIDLEVSTKKKYSSVFVLGNEGLTVKKKFRIYLADSLVPGSLREKAFICREIKKKTAYLETVCKDGWYEAKTNRFGKFYLLVDTLAPKIQPVNLSKNMSAKLCIDFTITDNLSGVNTYNIYINDKWVLGEYEPKLKRLRYIFDSRLPKAEEYKIRVVVSDNVGNITIYENGFVR